MVSYFKLLFLCFIKGLRSIAFICLIMCAEACAQEGQKDHENVRQALDYINSIKTLQADLVQVNPDGTVQKGDLKISRPGCMRLTYAKPSHIVLICDGIWMIVRDSLRDETTYLSLEETPAALLLTHPLEIKNDVKIHGVREEAGLLRIQMSPRRDENYVRLTLVFTQHPFQLRQWISWDEQGGETIVTLENIRTGLSFDPKLFRYHEKF